MRSVHDEVKSGVPAELVTHTNAAQVSRRRLLRGIFLGLSAPNLPSWILEPTVARAQELGGPELAMPFGPLAAQDYGPLVAQLVEDDLMAVDHQLYAPADFRVRVIMRAGVNPLTKTTAGTTGHTAPDGGAVFMAPDGGWVYVSNSESTPGGVSAFRFDANGTLVDYYRICMGTRRNCAGGQTPWGTWITCEEVTGGYAFECDPFGSPDSQRRLDALSARNNREAVAIDPLHHVCYQTLDTSTGKFLRFASDPSDLEVTPSGVTRMRLQTGVSRRLLIPAHGDLPGYESTTVPNDALGSSRLRQARPIEWVDDTGTNGTNFNGAEGLWYYELPEPLRTVPALGTAPTRGVVFFATKGDNRIWAIDIENDLIELIYDTHNGQAFTNLRNADGSLGNFDEVDNVVISPGGDVLVAEDGPALRLAIVRNNEPAKLLVQITRGGSELCGPAFTPDGSRLYFSSQRGPSGASGTGSSGVVYELTIPPQFRAIQRAEPFDIEERLNVAPGMTVTSQPFVVEGFIGPLTISITQEFDAQYSVNGGAWSSTPSPIYSGASVRVRHTSSADIGEVVETTVTVGLANGVSRTEAVFHSHTSAPDAIPDPFDFGTQTGVPGNTWIESAILRLEGFNVPARVTIGPHAEYRIDGGPWTTEPGMLHPDQTIQMRHISNRPCHSVRRTHLKVGGVTGHFTTRTA
jgi:hypothetical protein